MYHWLVIITNLTITLYGTNFVLLQFYIIEGRLEILARHMLFLTLIMEPHDKIGLRGVSVSYVRVYTCKQTSL